MAATVLNSVQQHLLKMFAFDGSEERLNEVKEVLTKYKLGTSANIKNLRKATLGKDLIDVLFGNIIEIQDPAFEYWLKYVYR